MINYPAQIFEQCSTLISSDDTQTCYIFPQFLRYERKELLKLYSFTKKTRIGKVMEHGKHISQPPQDTLSRGRKKKKKIEIFESLETCEYLFLTCQYERTYNCDRLLPLDIIYQLHGNGISSSRSIRHASNERVVRGNRAVASVYVKRIP